MTLEAFLNTAGTWVGSGVVVVLVNWFLNRNKDRADVRRTLAQAEHSEALAESERVEAATGIIDLLRDEVSRLTKEHQDCETRYDALHMQVGDQNRAIDSLRQEVEALKRRQRRN